MPNYNIQILYPCQVFLVKITQKTDLFIPGRKIETKTYCGKPLSRHIEPKAFGMVGSQQRALADFHRQLTSLVRT